MVWEIKVFLLKYLFGIVFRFTRIGKIVEFQPPLCYILYDKKL